MNSHAEYRRHSYQPPATHARTPTVETAVNHLAIAADPSLKADGPATRPPKDRRLAWVRPTDLMTYAGPLVGRGIDLQAHLMRRARRTPVAGAEAASRTVHHSAPQPSQTTASQQEGLQL